MKKADTIFDDKLRATISPCGSMRDKSTQTGRSIENEPHQIPQPRNAREDVERDGLEASDDIGIGIGRDSG